MRTTLAAEIVRSAEAGLALQRADGSLPPGHNGPHGDPEQPSRNTGHWLMTWARAHRESGDERFRAAAARAADYLMLDKHRPGGFTVHHRDTVGKDRCNGLMGPAFTLESLVTGGLFLDRSDMLALAAKIVAIHPYDSTRCLWYVREVDGSLPGFDVTLNHQIWFAATAAMSAAANGQDFGNIAHFLENLRRTTGLRANGRIRHQALDLSATARARRWVRSLRGKEERVTERAEKREIAYHFFSVHPLTILRQHLPDSPYWKTELFARLYAYPAGPEYSSAGADPGFVQPYIPAGYPFSFAERAFANQVFGPADRGFQTAMMTEQFARTYDPETALHTHNSADPVTQAARGYELSRIGDVAFDMADLQRERRT